MSRNAQDLLPKAMRKEIKRDEEGEEELADMQ